jgi:hypothetical protein
MSNLDYHVHTELNLIEIRPTGEVKVEDILSYAHEVLSRDILTEGTIEYYDLSGMTNLRADYESAWGLSGALQEWVSSGWHGSVFYTPEPYQFGMIRMMGAILESIQDAPDVLMIPSHEPLALEQVRSIIDERRRTRNS